MEVPALKVQPPAVSVPPLSVQPPSVTPPVMKVKASPVVAAVMSTVPPAIELAQIVVQPGPGTSFESFNVKAYHYNNILYLIPAFNEPQWRSQ